MPHLSRLADALSLAAAPTFAILTVINAVSENGGPVVLCSGGSGVSGMTIMYALMSAFHAAPWLRLISRNPRRRQSACGRA
jgi:hypothetical protein